MCYIVPMERYRKGRTCANCGVAVGDRGPDSRSGRYFCRQEDCRAVRDAERQAVRREPSWKAAALKVAAEIDEERQRDAPKVAELRAAGMTYLQIQQQFPMLRQ